MRVFSGAKQLVKVSKARQGRYKLDAALCTVTIKLHDLFCSQRSVISPQLCHAAEQIGMLYVQL